MPPPPRALFHALALAHDPLVQLVLWNALIPYALDIFGSITWIGIEGADQWARRDDEAEPEAVMVAPMPVSPPRAPSQTCIAPSPSLSLSLPSIVATALSPATPQLALSLSAYVAPSTPPQTTTHPMHHPTWHVVFLLLVRLVPAVLFFCVAAWCCCWAVDRVEEGWGEMLLATPCQELDAIFSSTATMRKHARASASPTLPRIVVTPCEEEADTISTRHIPDGDVVAATTNPPVYAHVHQEGLSPSSLSSKQTRSRISCGRAGPEPLRDDFEHHLTRVQDRERGQEQEVDGARHIVFLEHAFPRVVDSMHLELLEQLCAYPVPLDGEVSPDALEPDKEANKRGSQLDAGVCAADNGVYECDVLRAGIVSHDDAALEKAVWTPLPDDDKCPQETDSLLVDPDVRKSSPSIQLEADESVNINRRIGMPGEAVVRTHGDEDNKLMRAIQTPLHDDEDTSTQGRENGLLADHSALQSDAQVHNMGIVLGFCDDSSEREAPPSQLGTSTGMVEQVVEQDAMVIEVASLELLDYRDWDENTIQTMQPAVDNDEGHAVADSRERDYDLESPLARDCVVSSAFALRPELSGDEELETEIRDSGTSLQSIEDANERAVQTPLADDVLVGSSQDQSDDLEVPLADENTTLSSQGAEHSESREFDAQTYNCYECALLFGSQGEPGSIGTYTVPDTVLTADLSLSPVVPSPSTDMCSEDSFYSCEGEQDIDVPQFASDSVHSSGASTSRAEPRTLASSIHAPGNSDIDASRPTKASSPQARTLSTSMHAPTTDELQKTVPPRRRVTALKAEKSWPEFVTAVAPEERDMEASMHAPRRRRDSYALSNPRPSKADAALESPRVGDYPADQEHPDDEMSFSTDLMSSTQPNADPMPSVREQSRDVSFVEDILTSVDVRATPVEGVPPSRALETDYYALSQSPEPWHTGVHLPPLMNYSGTTPAPSVPYLQHATSACCPVPPLSSNASVESLLSWSGTGASSRLLFPYSAPIGAFFGNARDALPVPFLQSLWVEHPGQAWTSVPQVQAPIYSTSSLRMPLMAGDMTYSSRTEVDFSGRALQQRIGVALAEANHLSSVAVTAGSHSGRREGRMRGDQRAVDAQSGLKRVRSAVCAVSGVVEGTSGEGDEASEAKRRRTGAPVLPQGAGNGKAPPGGNARRRLHRPGPVVATMKEVEEEEEL